MSFVLYAFLFIILLSCLAMIGSQGIWSSLITFFNVLMAIVLALNLFEPAATWLDSQMPSYTFLIDVVVLWGLFTIFVTVFSLLTGLLSRVKVRFVKPIDLAGGVLISLWTAWLLISFALVSLHTAPLPRNAFGGAFQPEPDSRMVMGADRKLLAFMHSVTSLSAFSRTPPSKHAVMIRDDRDGDGELSRSEVSDRFRLAFEKIDTDENGYIDNDECERFQGSHAFDPEGKFILTYGARREVFETTRDLRVNRVFGEGVIEQENETREQ